MPDARPLKPSVALIHTTVGDLVQMQDRDVPAGSGAVGPMKLRAGEVVRCLRNDEYGVLVARGDGSRVLVPVQSAKTAGIRWFPGPLEPDGSMDGGGRATEANPEQRAGSWRSRRRRLQAGHPGVEGDVRGV